VLIVIDCPVIYYNSLIFKVTGAWLTRTLWVISYHYSYEHQATDKLSMLTVAPMKANLALAASSKP
jgi:hypothetical protein